MLSMTKNLVNQTGEKSPDKVSKTDFCNAAIRMHLEAAALSVAESELAGMQVRVDKIRNEITNLKRMEAMHRELRRKKGQ